METIKINASRNDGKLDICIVDKPISINLDGDIDLTSFVNELYLLIDKNITIEFSNSEEDSDPKTKMVIDIITSMISKYNEVIETDIEELSHINDKNPVSENAEDIPF